MTDLELLGDHLRRAFLAGVGVTNPLPWAALQDSERRRWLDAAEAHRKDAA